MMLCNTEQQLCEDLLTIFFSCKYTLQLTEWKLIEGLKAWTYTLSKGVDCESGWWWVQRSTEPSSVFLLMWNSSSWCFLLLLSLVSFLVQLHLLDARGISNKALTLVAKTAEPQKSPGWKRPQNIIWSSLSWEGEPGWNYRCVQSHLETSSSVACLHPWEVVRVTNSFHYKKVIICMPVE